MTAAREMIEPKQEPRLVEPEPNNISEALILEEIERQYCRLDNAHHAFIANFCGWQAGNDIGKCHLDECLETIGAASQAMRERIDDLAERRVREPEDVKLEASAERIQQVTAGMIEDGYDYRELPGQIERIEAVLQSMRDEFDISTY